MTDWQAVGAVRRWRSQKASGRISHLRTGCATGGGTSRLIPRVLSNRPPCVLPEPIQRNLPDALEGAGGWGVEGRWYGG